MDHRRILDWADTHIAHFEKLAQTYTSKHPGRLVTKLDYKTGEQVVYYQTRPLPERDKWAFVIGDALHNLRVSLDYLTFQIVKPDPADRALVRKTQFPIATRDVDWNGVKAHRLSTLPPEVQDVFEDLQPYHGRHAPRLEPLLVLDALENVHKHRHVLDAFPSITSHGFNFDPAKLNITYTGAPFGPVEDRQELYRYPIPKPEDIPANPQFSVRTHICFDREGPARGHIVITALREIRDHIRDVVFPVLEPHI